MSSEPSVSHPSVSPFLRCVAFCSKYHSRVRWTYEVQNFHLGKKSLLNKLGQSDPITGSRKIENTKSLTPIRVLPGGEVNCLQTKGLSVGNGYFPKKIMSTLLLEKCWIIGSKSNNIVTTDIPKNLMKLSIFLGNKPIGKHKTKTKSKGYMGLKGVKDSMKLVLRCQLLYKIPPLGIVLKWCWCWWELTWLGNENSGALFGTRQVSSPSYIPL